jgi:serine/threonine protein kinase
MKKLSHPNFIKILDVDPQREWFVSQFYTRGTLSNNKEIFTGDLVKSLNAFRPLAEAVAQLYQNKIVHRDIKPQNVFLDVDGRLILGDFGLVYFADQQHTRISETFENVGSHDWMPGWAMGMKIEDIKPTFDVFCLGKLLWAMLSKTPILRLWYYDKPEFDLEKMFPNKPEMKWANELFKKCIVEEERNCLPDASALLEEVDKVITAVNYHADVIGDKIIRRCKVCGIGNYNQIVNEESTAGIQNFGFVPAGTRTFKIYTCTHCGHVQFFTYERKDKRPQAWLK